MGNAFINAAARLAASTKLTAGVSVTYQAGSAAAVAITARVGRTNYESSDAGGQSVRAEVRDYLVDVADLISEPAQGDLIRETRGSTTYVYEVGPLGDDPPWRYSDAGHVQYRMHTRLIDTEEVEE